MIYIHGCKSLVGKECINVFQTSRIPVCTHEPLENSLEISDYIKFLKDKSASHILCCSDYVAPEDAEVDIEKAEMYGYSIPSILSQVSKELDIPLIFISNEFVFDGKKFEGYKEIDICNPETTYGKMYVKGEEAVQKLTPKHFIIRVPWIYGRFVQNYVYMILNLIIKRSTITVVDDQTGTPTNALHLAQFIIKLLTSPSAPYGIYHFANDGFTDWYEFTTKIFKFAVVNKIVPATLQASVNIYPISTDLVNEPLNRPKHSVFDCSKVKSIFHIQIEKWDNALDSFISKLKPITRI